MRLGLFGGSFNPVHLGHLLVARAAIEELSLDRLFLIPAAQSPFKPQQVLAPAADRLRLLRLALAGWTQTEVDTQEIDRGGISYTIQTVEHYRRRFPESSLFWLIGADHLPTLPAWRDAPTLARSVEFVVVPRPGQLPFTPAPPFRVSTLNGFPVAISASEIRTRIREGKPVDFMVPPGVDEAIRNNRLYL